MKKTSTLALLALIASPAFAQEDKAQRDAAAKELTTFSKADTTGKLWTTGGVFQVNLTQVSLTNWAAGGFNSIGGIAQFNGFANRHKGRNVWDNSLVLAFGGQLQAAQGIPAKDGIPVKTDDRIELNTKWGRELKKPWYFAALGQFRTQFTEGFDGTGTRISNLFAPAYLITGIGFDYRPNDDFSVFISPATMKLTIVNDKRLWGGSTDPELRVFNVKNGSTTEFELGGYVRFQYKRDLAKNINFLTRGDLFSNYLRDPQNIDITWETLWTFKVNSWFAATLNTMLIYDDNIDVPRLKEVDGVKVADPGPGTQFKQTLGIGLTFKL
ncbi:MAG: DUF3078 domain-containing protein [Flavobacteriales bacterium]